ncbi:MAG: hypothetical protein WC346_11675 [Methanogenium sp.]|jgi:hypothetical protein
MKYRYFRYKKHLRHNNLSDYEIALSNTESYSPIGQHMISEISFLEHNCDEITKEEYIEATKSLFTPPEYL